MGGQGYGGQGYGGAGVWGAGVWAGRGMWAWLGGVLVIAAAFVPLGTAVEDVSLVLTALQAANGRLGRLPLAPVPCPPIREYTLPPIAIPPIWFEKVRKRE